MSLRRSKRISNPPERLGFEGVTSNSRSDTVSVATRGSSASEYQEKMYRAEWKFENELSTDLPDDRKELLIAEFEDDPTPWMSSENERTITIDEQDSHKKKVHLKKYDRVKFLRNGELVAACMLHTTKKKAQVRIERGGEVVWKMKKILPWKSFKV